MMKNSCIHKRFLLEKKNERLKLASRIITYFIQHYPELLTIAVRMTKNYVDAEDIMQNVAVVLCKKEKELEKVKNCGAYIAVCIRRSAISLFRQKAHEKVLDPSFIEGYQDSLLSKEIKHGDSEYDYLEWVTSLESQLTAYSQEMRSAFFAHYVDGVPLGELASKLGLSVKALSGRFARMRKALKNHARSLFNQFNVLLLL